MTCMLPGGIGQLYASTHAPAVAANLCLHLDSDFSDATYRHTAIAGFGAAAISTAQKQFGAGSLYVDNSAASYLKVTDNLSDFTFTGTFTIDCWVYPTSFATEANFFNPGNDQLHFYTSSGGILTIYWSGATGVYDSVALPLNTWTHAAITRDAGNTLRLFKNGVYITGQVLSGTVTPDVGGIWIGRSFSGGQQTQGYIDEFRVLNGTAAWTATFTPPTAPYS